MIIIDGKVAGLWKRAIKKDSVHIEMQYFSSMKKSQVRDIHEAGKKYGDYMGKKIVFV